MFHLCTKKPAVLNPIQPTRATPKNPTSYVVYFPKDKIHMWRHHTDHPLFWNLPTHRGPFLISFPRVSSKPQVTIYQIYEANQRPWLTELHSLIRSHYPSYSICCCFCRIFRNPHWFIDVTWKYGSTSPVLRLASVLIQMNKIELMRNKHSKNGVEKTM